MHTHTVHWSTSLNIRYWLKKACEGSVTLTPILPTEGQPSLHQCGYIWKCVFFILFWTLSHYVDAFSTPENIAFGNSSTESVLLNTAVWHCSISKNSLKLFILLNPLFHKWEHEIRTSMLSLSDRSMEFKGLADAAEPFIIQQIGFYI